MKKESVVVSLRIPRDVYEMLVFISRERKGKYASWVEQYGPVGCISEDVTPSSVAKSLLVSAIGKEYLEVKNA